MRYNLVHNLLSVVTNRNYIPYFHFSPALDDFVKGKPKHVLKYYVRKDLRRPKDLTQKFDFCWAKKDSKRIYYEHPLAFGYSAKILLDMTDNEYSLSVNPFYNSFIKFRFENVWSPGQHFSGLVEIKLLQEGILTFHCASFSDKKTHDGYLLFGASNTGKSYTVFNAVKKGYQYHSEDLTLLDDSFIYTLPTISVNSKNLPQKDLLLKLHLFIVSRLFINLLIPRFYTTNSYKKFVEGIDVKSRSKLRKIFILERGQGGLKKLTSNEAFNKILLLNRIELSYYKDHLFRSYAYFNDNLDIEKLYDFETNLTKKLIEQCECYVVSSNNPDDYFPLIEEVIT